MKSISQIILFAFCLSSSPLFGEIWGNVEFHLPNEGREWVIGNKIISDLKIKGRTVVYLPKYATKEDTKEFFGINISEEKNIVLNLPVVEEMIQQLYPEYQVEVITIEQSPTSMLYEWILSQMNQEKMRGLTRIISTKKEWATLSYQTEDLIKFQEEKNQWIDILKKVRFINRDSF